MKVITFNVLSGIPEFNVLKTAPLIELIQDIPFLLSYKIIPSFKILNGILKSGVVNAGMDGGCEWLPFDVSIQEYEELVTELINFNSYLSQAEPPDWVNNYPDWQAWVRKK